MTVLRVAALVAVLLLAGCTADDPVDPLLAQVRDGGLVLLVRHTETARGGVDDLASLGDCAAQRPLTDRGREQARELGEALRALELPVGDVIASPFCRTVETAELAFGDVRQDDALLALASFGEDGDASYERAEAAARALLADPVADGENTVLVTHTSTIEPLTGSAPEEGGTVVVRVGRDGTVEVVGEVAPGGWSVLADDDR